eukprot:CAMPEP_0178374038 /NCGR_PEP_ID=MMETSP0689_2-20121128/2173_1 /TAXON_ID=160604 /ORGANISM="Amphidinium massartii, Strain CS-259" /LENGTH=529 /DNA_ID=CAMNT_0019994001 /DNA_START=114 /DNA_END=1701 /DNA_ORIENTATION=+
MAILCPDSGNGTGPAAVHEDEDSLTLLVEMETGERAMSGDDDASLEDVATPAAQANASEAQESVENYGEGFRDPLAAPVQEEESQTTVVLTANEKASRCRGTCRFNRSCDDFLRSDPVRFSCQRLQKVWGCNCEGCACKKPVSKAYRPAASRPFLLKFPAQLYPRAVCLDGSQAGIYVRLGAVQKILVYLAPGGWCYDDRCSPSPSAQRTLAACRSRATTVLGSSKHWSQHWNHNEGYLSADPHQNPVFHNWTLVVVPYCDGTSFTGDADIKGVHFHGKAILDAAVSELLQLGARKATKVVLAGASAGATALFFHADSIKEKLALTTGEVVILADAGFFLNRRVKANKHSCWPEQFRSVMKLSGACENAHPACLARFPKDPCRCLYPEYFADLIKTRIMIVQSPMDYSEVRYTLGVECTMSSRRTCGSTGDAANRLIRLLRNEHFKTWGRLIRRAGNGVFAPSCIAHQMSPFWKLGLKVPQQQPVKMSAIVGRWLWAEPQKWAHMRFTYEEPIPKEGKLSTCAAGHTDD